MKFDLKKCGDTVTREIKSASWFPFKSGNLKDHATKGEMLDNNTYVIHFSSQVAPYLEALEEGSRPHDIPFAFIGKDPSKWEGKKVWWYPYGDGIPFLMGMGGRFDGKFHPGSTKHKGFIKNKSVGHIVSYIVSHYGGRLG